MSVVFGVGSSSPERSPPAARPFTADLDLHADAHLHEVQSHNTPDSLG